jgi:[ribosomal protein S18]-alanine N-acetyltransferase
LSIPHIRSATVADLATFLRLDSDIFALSAYSEGQWLSEFAADSAMLLIAEIERVHLQGIGFLSGNLVGDDFEIRKIGVMATERRLGIARHLLHTAAQNAVRLLPPTARCLIDVAVDNEPALALYNSFGFTQMALRKRYYSSGVDAIVMEKILSGV